MNKNKGFTLIELLVVIAIIGILSSVVLASLSSARQKAKVAALQSTLSSMRAQAETGMVNGKYVADICNKTSAEGGLRTLLDSLNTTASKVKSISCSADGQSAADPSYRWAVEASIGTSPTYYCTDSTGYSGLSKKTDAADGAASTLSAPATTPAGSLSPVYGATGADYSCTQ